MGETPPIPSPPNRPTEDPQLAAEAWSAAARGYKQYWAPRFRPYLARAVAALEPAPSGPLAVPGCGPGEEVLLLAERFPDRSIVATDPAASMLALLWESLRERRCRNVIAAFGSARELSGSVRQAAGILSAFSLQLLPDPVDALADWSLALRPGGTIAAIFWPAPQPGTPYANLRQAIEEVTGEARAEWEEAARGSLSRLGLELMRDETVSFVMEHSSPEEFFQALVDWGPLQVLLRRRGADVLSRCKTRWLEEHGLRRDGSRWLQEPAARLWVMRRGG